MNKIDLDNHKPALEAIKKKYSGLPYPILATSKLNTANQLDSLSETLQNKTCIFAGQSGVGKSTLINKLIPELSIETNAISETSRQGRHTTSATTLYDLPLGGELIDSPGVREFTMPKLDSNSIANGFIEIEKHASMCKFHNCKHIQEPKCAVLEAVTNSEINNERYASYVKMLGNIEEEKY